MDLINLGVLTMIVFCTPALTEQGCMDGINTAVNHYRAEGYDVHGAYLVPYDRLNEMMIPFAEKKLKESGKPIPKEINKRSCESEKAVRDTIEITYSCVY